MGHSQYRPGAVLYYSRPGPTAALDSHFSGKSAKDGSIALCEYFRLLKFPDSLKAIRKVNQRVFLNPRHEVVEMIGFNPRDAPFSVLA